MEANARENADERGRCEVKWKKVSTQEGVVHFLVGSEALCLVAAVRDSQYSTPRTEAPTVRFQPEHSMSAEGCIVQYKDSMGHPLTGPPLEEHQDQECPECDELLRAWKATTAEGRTSATAPTPNFVSSVPTGGTPPPDAEARCPCSTQLEGGVTLYCGRPPGHSGDHSYATRPDTASEAYPCPTCHSTGYIHGGDQKCPSCEDLRAREWTVYAARDGTVHAVVPGGVTWTQEGEDAAIHKFRIQRQAKFDRERAESERLMAAASRERPPSKGFKTAPRDGTILRLGLPRAASDDGPSTAAKRVAAAIGAVLASAFLWCFIALFVPLGISTPIAFLSLLIGGAVLQVLPHAMAYAPQKAPQRPQPTPTPVAAPAPVVPPLKDHSDRSIEAHNGLPCETCGISLEDTFDWWSRQHPTPTEEAK